MVVVELTYKATLDVIDTYLSEHRAFLQKYYDEGRFIASGPQSPRKGGIILALGSKKHVEDILKDDPFFKHDLAEFRFIEFEPVKYCAALGPLIIE